MRELNHALASLFLALLLAIPLASAQDRAADEHAIRGTVQTYFAGLENRDVERLNKAFHPDAKMATITRDGRISEMTIAQFCEMARPKPQEPAKWELTGRIESIELTGEAAVVKATVEFAKVVHSDYLSLLRVNGEWRIVHKIYHTRRK